MSEQQSFDPWKVGGEVAADVTFGPEFGPIGGAVGEGVEQILDGIGNAAPGGYAGQDPSDPGYAGQDPSDPGYADQDPSDPGGYGISGYGAGQTDGAAADG